MWHFYGKLVNRLPLCFRHPNRIFLSNGKHPWCSSGVTKVTALLLASFVAMITYCVLVQFYTRIYLEEGEMWREIYSNIVIVKLLACAVVCVSLPGVPPGGGGEDLS